MAFLCLAGEERVVLETPAGEIHGWLTIPDGQTDSVVVLIVGGSGPVDHDGNAPGMVSNSYRFLAADLARAGIASLRFDKRGVAASSAAAPSESGLRFDHYIDDVRAWISFLAGQDRFRRIFLAGHSEGALIVTEAAADDPEVAGAILIAGTGRPLAEVIHAQLAAQLPPDLLRQADAILDSLQTGRRVTDVPQLLYALFRPSVQPYMISWMRCDPVRSVARLQIPVLVVQGSTDIQVGVEDAENLASASLRGVKSVIEGMNHVMKACASTEMSVQLATYFDPDKPNHPELARTIVAFIEKDKGVERAR